MVKKNKVPLFLLVLFLFYFLVGPKQNIKTVDLTNKFLGISAEHWMGTDNLGRDVYSLVAAGGARTLEVTAVGLAVSGLVGSFLGTLSAFGNSSVRSIIQFLADFTLIIPTFIMALVMAAVFGFSPMLVGAVLGIGNMGDYINQSFDLAKAVKSEEFIDAETVIGVRKLRIILIHVLPNIAGQLLVFMGNHVSSIIIQYAGLAYIGLGTDYTNPDWGTLIYQYRSYLITHPILVICPSMAICFVTIFFHRIFDTKEGQNRSVVGYD